MPVAKPWTFAQLSGDQTVLTLSGWQAPFGRPRQGTIVNTGVTVRRTVTYYPDGNAGPTPPTVHSFGLEPKPLELHGRWMDRAIGVLNGARQLQQQWRQFVSAKQLVRAKWGDILSYIIFIHDIDLQFESEAHIVWKLTADVIKDEQATVVTFTAPKKTPADFSSDLQSMLAASTLQTPIPLTLRGFLGSITDQLDLLVSAINTPAQVIFSVCSAIGDFETALSSDLVVLGSGLQTMKTGILNLRDMTEVAMSEAEILNLETVDLPNGLFSASDVVTMRANKIQQDKETENILALISDMQNEIALAQRGQSLAAHMGQDGDTWEKIASNVYGDPSAARAIKDMNAVRYGQRVQAGRVYQLPRSG